MSLKGLSQELQKTPSKAGSVRIEPKKAAQKIGKSPSKSGSCDGTPRGLRLYVATAPRYEMPTLGTELTRPRRATIDFASRARSYGRGFRHSRYEGMP